MDVTISGAGRPQPRLKVLWLVKAFLLGLGAGAAAAVLALPLLTAAQNLPARAVAGPIAAVAFVVWAVVSLGLAWRALVAWRVYRWECRPGEGVVVWQGAWWQREVWIPMTRLQHLDIKRGPLERAMGLATLELYTAGSHAYETRLPGLEPQQALMLRDGLLAELQALARPAPGMPATSA